MGYISKLRARRLTAFTLVPAAAPANPALWHGLRRPAGMAAGVLAVITFTASPCIVTGRSKEEIGAQAPAHVCI